MKIHCGFHLSGSSRNTKTLLQKLFLPCYCFFPVSPLFFASFLIGEKIIKKENPLLSATQNPQVRNTEIKTTGKKTPKSPDAFLHRISKTSFCGETNTQTTQIQIQKRKLILTAVLIYILPPHPPLNSILILCYFREANNWWKRLSWPKMPTATCRGSASGSPGAGQPPVVVNSLLIWATGCWIRWRLLSQAGKEGAVLLQGRWC